MISSGNMMKSVLVAIVLMALSQSGSAAEKVSSCCKTVSSQKITDRMLGYLVLSKPVLPCVKAVVLQTEKGMFCIRPGAPWLRSKIQAFHKTKSQMTASPSTAPSRVSLLSIITSTAPSPSTAAPLPSSTSSFSTAAMPVGENMSDQSE